MAKSRTSPCLVKLPRTRVVSSRVSTCSAVMNCSSTDRQQPQCSLAHYTYTPYIPIPTPSPHHFCTICPHPFPTTPSVPIPAPSPHQLISCFFIWWLQNYTILFWTNRYQYIVRVNWLSACYCQFNCHSFTLHFSSPWTSDKEQQVIHSTSTNTVIAVLPYVMYPCRRSHGITVHMLPVTVIMSRCLAPRSNRK